MIDVWFGMFVVFGCELVMLGNLFVVKKVDIILVLFILDESV